MRRTQCVFAAILLALPAPAAAQVQAEIGPSIGYRFGGSLADNGGTSYDIESAVSYGAVVDLDLHRDLCVEFVWSHQGSELALRDVLEPGPFTVSVDHWMIGPWYGFGSPAARVRPFASFLLGMSQYSTDIAEGESRARFALGAGAGAKFFPHPRVGLRLEGRGFFTFTDEGTNLFCSTTLNACPLQFKSDLMVQGELAASVVVVLGPLRRQ
jgi:Outer membrane protein beta-barrel domain